MKKIYLSLLLLFATYTAQAQLPPQTPKERLELANKLFNSFDYTQAAEQYKKLVRGNKTENFIRLRLAECYYNIFNTIESAKWYAKAIETEPNLGAEVYYKYAQMLKASGRYQASNEVMKKFATLRPKDSRTLKFLKDPDYIPNLRKQEALFSYEDSGVNDGFFSDFCGVLTNENDFYFASARNNKRDKKYGWNQQPYLDIFSAKFDLETGKFSEIKPVEELNTKYHDGPVSITADGQTMYFSSESFRSSKYVVNRKKRLKFGKVNVFRAKFDGKKWSEVEAVPFNGENYMVSNPSISPDGKTLYFASDMPGGKGGMDIWKVDVAEDGTYGEPENLGDAVNTEARESFPFITSNNKLYFSSDGLQGFGGLDIYSIDLSAKGALAKNLGNPINTAKDDFGFSYYPEKNIGFFSTNRVGRDDIYKAIPVCLSEVEVTVTDNKTGKILTNTQVAILDQDKNIIETKTTDSNGIVRYEADCKKLFSLQVTKPDYEGTESQLTQTVSGKVPIEIKLRKIEEIVTPQKIELGEVYFEFDKSNITPKGAFELNKLVQIMQNKPSMRIRIESHTDSKGDDLYNLKLSARRAKTTKEFLISSGVDANRIEAVGLGETQPKIDCKSGCTDQQHAANRRSEFIII